MNLEQEAIKKTVTIFEEALNEMSYDSDSTEMLGAMVKGFKIGYRTATKIKNFYKEREYEDIPF